MALTEAGAAALGSASAVGSGIAGAITQSIQNKKNRAFESEQASLQRDWSERMYNQQNVWNLEQWQRQIEYNNPVNQVQRLRDAGLNPLFYGLDGTGNASELTAAQPLGYERATIGNQVNPFAVGLQSGTDLAMKVAQIGNVRANTAKTSNENLTETVRREQMQTDIEKTKQELNNLLASERLTDAQREQILANLSWLDRMNEAIIGEKQANAALNEAQKHRIEELLEGEKLIQSRTAKDFLERWKLIQPQINLMAKQTGLLAKDIENYAINHMSNGFMGTGLSLQNMFRSIGEAADAVKNKFSPKKK